MTIATRPSSACPLGSHPSGLAQALLVPRDEPTATAELRAPPSDTWLVELAQPGGLTTLTLKEGQRREIGSRGSGSVIRLLDPAVSGRHAAVAVRGGHLEVEDLGSRNGVWVAGGRVPRLTIDRVGSFVVGRTLVTCRAHVEQDTADLMAEAPLAGVVGESLAMRRVARQVRQLAPLRAPVLVRGETGSGKELIAHALHRLSPRDGKPFVPLNMGALPGELADAELFGHERGAFTGATTARPGAFEAARGGTLFLDEVAELPMASQAKLLRALEGGEVRALGAQAARRVDVRVVAATWAPLETLVSEKGFREDLFHRLAVLQIHLPPLRERAGDIPMLSANFLAAMVGELGERTLTSGALSRLAAHHWPGNVRELRNVLLRSAIASPGRFVTTEHVELAIGLARGAPRKVGTPERKGEAKAVLAAHGGNVSSAARALGVARSTLRQWAR